MRLVIRCLHLLRNFSKRLKDCDHDLMMDRLFQFFAPKKNCSSLFIYPLKIIQLITKLCTERFKIFPGNFICKRGQFKCYRSYCIDNSQVCDRQRIDCVNTGDDEQGCGMFIYDFKWNRYNTKTSTFSLFLIFYACEGAILHK